MKKMNVKRILAMLTAVLVLMFATAVSGSTDLVEETESENTQNEDEESEEQKVIGVSLASEYASYQQALGNLLEKQAERNPHYKLDIQYAGWSLSEQETQLKTFIEEGVAAIILCPVNAKSFLNILKDAKKAGIPVVNLNMKVDTVSTEYITTYVGGSMSEEADMAGQMAVECLDGKGKVGIIEGTQGSDPQIYRTQTFLEYIDSYPEIEVVGIMEGNWSRHKAALAALDLIKKDKDIDLIYCHDSNMAMGVYEMLEEKGLEKQIHVIGIGSEQTYVDAVRDGKLYGIVTQSPEFEASFAWSCAKRAAEGFGLRFWYKTPARILTKETADQKQNS